MSSDKIPYKSAVSNATDWYEIDFQKKVFTNSPQHQNANIANFVLALPFEMS